MIPFTYFAKRKGLLVIIKQGYFTLPKRQELESSVSHEWSHSTVPLYAILESWSKLGFPRHLLEQPIITLPFWHLLPTGGGCEVTRNPTWAEDRLRLGNRSSSIDPKVSIKMRLGERKYGFIYVEKKYIIMNAWRDFLYETVYN